MNIQTLSTSFSLLIKDSQLNTNQSTVILMSNCNILDLNGHYENTEFCPPNWYTKLIEKSQNGQCALIIKGIDTIKKEEQFKFIELIKYKKISTFKIPTNCTIIVTYYNDYKLINEELYLLFDRKEID